MTYDLGDLFYFGVPLLELNMMISGIKNFQLS
jgi:hypothetical protein